MNAYYLSFLLIVSNCIMDIIYSVFYLHLIKGSGKNTSSVMTVPQDCPFPAAAIVIMFFATAILIIGTPASATLVLTGESFAPVPPLTAGDGQHAVVTVAVLPSGAGTFITTHTLQMQTGLNDARWSIAVVVDGRTAGQQSASGTSAFINGYLLSYPATSDVSFTVTLDGTVPSSAGTNVTILQVTELDTSGQPVPESSLAVAVPVTSPSAIQTALPQKTSSPMPSATPSPTRAGYPPAACLGAVVAAVAWCRYARIQR